ncbi:hypothetical protein [Helicobacter sp. 11S02596-1]|uniref:hypothetical protein n=1 Tax=Helicobacter sp. 11S02596-1 TaxID=1476194 RepID=UPI001179AA37|nr:hypothetical protein [Helicobacter sp. 11S02596-1]
MESFATSILNFGKAIQVIKESLEIEEKLDVKIIATKEGSFQVDLVLATQGMWQSFKGLFASEGASAITNIMSMLGIGISGLGGLFALYKHLGGKEPKNIEEKGNIVLIVDDGGIALDFAKKVVEIYQNPKFREYMENFIKNPLDSDEIDVISVKYNNDVLEIPKSDKDFYKKTFGQKNLICR